jgi:hypothetical protein
VPHPSRSLRRVGCDICDWDGTKTPTQRAGISCQTDFFRTSLYRLRKKSLANRLRPSAAKEAAEKLKLWKGTALTGQGKLKLLKGTAFRPYVIN